MLSTHVAESLRQSGRRIVITGAGGWIGLATLELLHLALGRDDFARRVVAFGSSERVLELRNGIEVVQRPLPMLPSLRPEPTLLLHLAFLTKDRAERMDEDDYVRTNRALSRLVLDSLDEIGAQGVFVASSGAAAFADDSSVSPAMRLYGSLKRKDEEAFAGWADGRGKSAVIARIFNLSGPYINKHSSYALASFILDAQAGRSIEIRATRAVMRGYVAVRELMSLVFALLLGAEQRVIRFDTGGVPMEMQDIAEAVAAQCGPAAVHRPCLNDGERADEYFGDHARYLGLLAGCGVRHVAFSQQVSETAEFLTENNNMGWQPKERRDSAVAAR
jgi:nucleoside-diphosphate-sugar epimerase